MKTLRVYISLFEIVLQAALPQKESCKLFFGIVIVQVLLAKRFDLCGCSKICYTKHHIPRVFKAPDIINIMSLL